MPLLQLLGLLLVLLFRLLFPRLIRILFGELLMLLLLLLLKLLSFLPLFLLELLLLLLILLVGLRIARVGSGGTLHRRKVIGMIGGGGRGGGAAAILIVRLRRSSIGGRVVRTSSLSRWDGFMPSECAGPGGGSDWRLAMICRRSEFWIPAGGLHLLHLSSCRGNMTIPRRCFILRSWPGVDPTIDRRCSSPGFRRG